MGFYIKRGWVSGWSLLTQSVDPKTINIGRDGRKALWIWSFSWKPVFRSSCSHILYEVNQPPPRQACTRTRTHGVVILTLLSIALARHVGTKCALPKQVPHSLHHDESRLLAYLWDKGEAHPSEMGSIISEPYSSVRNQKHMDSVLSFLLLL